MLLYTMDLYSGLLVLRHAIVTINLHLITYLSWAVKGSVKASELDSTPEAICL